MLIPCRFLNVSFDLRKVRITLEVVWAVGQGQILLPPQTEIMCSSYEWTCFVCVDGGVEKILRSTATGAFRMKAATINGPTLEPLSLGMR